MHALLCGAALIPLYDIRLLARIHHATLKETVPCCSLVVKAGELWRIKAVCLCQWLGRMLFGCTL